MTLTFSSCSTSPRRLTTWTTDRWRVTFVIDNSALAWFGCYLSARRQHVRCGGKCSDVIDVICDVPQGLVLGPILFIIYTRLTWNRSFQSMACRCINTLTIAKYKWLVPTTCHVHTVVYRLTVCRQRLKLKSPPTQRCSKTKVMW